MVNAKMKKKTEESLLEVKKQAEEWKNKYLRALADYQNLEKRTRQEVHEARVFASEIVLGRLVSVADTFRKAGEHLQDPGLDLALKELDALFTEQGVEHIEVMGQIFDPHEMECVEVVGGEDNTVVEEILPGYRFRGKILRVAQVKVGKK